MTYSVNTIRFKTEWLKAKFTFGYIVTKDVVKKNNENSHCIIA